MPIWKTSETGLQQISETTLAQQQFLEEHLEDWIVANPDFLEEPLLIIGRQVLIPGVNDKIDVLALDLEGNAVIVELKRGQLTDPVDMQALRYASYVSRWSDTDFELQAQNYRAKGDESEFSFFDEFAQFCAIQGVKDVPALNADQRIILVGSRVRDKLGSVALWLREHSIDIKAIEVEVFQEGEVTFLQPRLIVPLPVDRFQNVVTNLSLRPWISNGREWHLEKQCGPKASEMLVELTDIINETCEGVEGPHWNQKFYVSYVINNRRCLNIITRKTSLILDFHMGIGGLNQVDLARKLGVVEYPVDGTLAEKLSLPSSISIDSQNPWGRLYIKEDFDLDSKEFRGFLKEAQAAFHKT